jgi:hypothetical protein
VNASVVPLMIVTLKEVRDALIDFYVDTVIADRNNTRDLISQPGGGIGKAIPPITDLSEEVIIQMMENDYPHLKDQWFEKHPECYAIAIESQEGNLTVVACNPHYSPQRSQQ